MKIENDKVILSKDWVAFSLCYDLQKIAGCAEDDPERLAEYQHDFSGGVSLLDLSPNDFNVLMRVVRGKPTKDELQTAYKKLFELFGPLEISPKEVLRHGFLSSAT